MAPFFFSLICALRANAGEGGTWPAMPAESGQRPFPVPEDRGPCFLAAARQRSPLDELRCGPLPPLRSGPAPPTRSSPRSPAMPEAGPLLIGTPNTRTPEVIAPARTPRQSLRLVSRRSQSRRCSDHPVACASLVDRRGSGSACAIVPTVIPPRRPHPQVRGTCGGIF